MFPGVFLKAGDSLLLERLALAVADSLAGQRSARDGQLIVNICEEFGSRERVFGGLLQIFERHVVPVPFAELFEKLCGKVQILSILVSSFLGGDNSRSNRRDHH